MSHNGHGGAIGRTEVAGGSPRRDGVAASCEVDEVDVARGREYGLLARLLSGAPDRVLLDRLADLPSDTSPLGLAHATLAEAASRLAAERVEREYFDLFIGVGRGELL